MDLELRGRLAIVTGYSVGIGRTIAQVLASEGAQIVVVARRGALLTTFDLWNESFAINFTARRKLTNACLPAMRAPKRGRIINITGSSEPVGMNAAGPAKAAVHVWAKGLSRQVGRDGITVNCLAPGRIHSEQIDQRLHPTEESQRAYAAQIPLGYFGDPEDMAYLVAFLCSPKARYITGERIHVDGGHRRTY